MNRTQPCRNEDSDQYVKSAEEWVPIPGSIEAIAALSQAGYSVAVATNQSGIARGYYDEAVLEQMHAKMRGLLAKPGGRIDYIAYCPHGPQDDCRCRKPLPGLLNNILQHFALQPGNGCFYLLRSGKGEQTLRTYPDVFDHDDVYADLAAFVAAFLQDQSVP